MNSRDPAFSFLVILCQFSRMRRSPVVVLYDPPVSKHMLWPYGNVSCQHHLLHVATCRQAGAGCHIGHLCTQFFSVNPSCPMWQPSPPENHLPPGAMPSLKPPGFFLYALVMNYIMNADGQACLLFVVIGHQVTLRRPSSEVAIVILLIQVF